MTKQSSWVWREWLENADYYSDAWRSDDGRWVTLEQRAPGQKPSDGNRPIEVAPGIILRSMPGSDGGGGFLWQQGGRSYSVSGGVESHDLVRQTAVAMYEAARSNA